jgi:hypothetical protein
MYSCGRIPPQELESKKGRRPYADKVYPIKLKFAVKLIRVLCHTMKVEPIAAYILKLKAGKYDIHVDSNPGIGVLKQTYEAVNICFAMGVALEVYFCARSAAYELSARMLKYFDTDRSGYLEFEEFSKMVILINSGADIDGEISLNNTTPQNRREQQVKKSTSRMSIQALLKQDMNKIREKSNISEVTLREMYLEACTGNTSTLKYKWEGNCDILEASVSMKGVTADTFMLTIITNKQMRDTVFEVQKQSKNMNLLYATLLFQNLVRRFLRRNRERKG